MTTKLADNFDTNVFINCPFDAAYESLVRPLLFTILFFDYSPKIASERSDSAEQRIEKITEFISLSRYSIHDLSRSRSLKKNELARHNMPFELGVDYGCRKFGIGRFREKKFLVLDTKQYDYSKALSDLAGIDIKSHANEPENIVRMVRNWFVDTVGIKQAPPAATMFGEFNEFMSDFDIERRKEGFNDDDLFEMPKKEFIEFMGAWLKSRRK